MDIAEDESEHSSSGWGSVGRQESIMNDVRARIDRLQCAQPSETQGSRSRCHSGVSLTLGSRSLSLFPPITEVVNQLDRRWCFMSFRVAVVGAVLLVILLSWGGMFVPLKLFTTSVRSAAIGSCERAIGAQQDLINNLTLASSRNTCLGILHEMAIMVESFVKTPTNSAVDALWGHLRTSYRFSNFWEGKDSFLQRRTLSYYAWQEVRSQWAITAGSYTPSDVSPDENGQLYPRLDWLHVTWDTEQMTGVQMMPGLSGTSASIEQYAYDSPGGVAGEPTNLTYWRVQPVSGDLIEPPVIVNKTTPTSRPYYRVQQHIAEWAESQPGGAANVTALRAWSELYFFLDGNLGLSWTAPVAHCGNYSCFAGTVSADIMLKSISWDCHQHWLALKRQVAIDGVTIGVDNSSIFIVNAYSKRFQSQQGLLVGSSHADLAMQSTNLTSAEDSPQLVVSTTAKVLLKRFHSWNDTALKSPNATWMSYRLSEVNLDLAQHRECEDDANPADDCLMVGVLPVWLEAQHLQWLLVVVLPARAFRRHASEVVADVGQDIAQYVAKSHRLESRSTTTGCVLLVGMLAVGTALSLFLGNVINTPLQRLCFLMQKLGDLDFSDKTGELGKLCAGELSCIRDVAKLQLAFCSLSRGTEAFARFIPETVVRHIVRGDERATRLHVYRREVTIMFSIIQDAASLSEKLAQNDFLFILTRYFSVMTRIVESFDGVVGEIMTEPPGLLVFWNTPQRTEDHAAKACAAAMAQQQAAQMLSEEFVRNSLPEIGIKIGIHTGPVLTGNIGSEMKMKFGCLGDPMNLASRLAGLCRFYGVGVMCSETTHAQLPEATFCRRLDLVKVKGKNEPTMIYEVIGQEVGTPCTSPVARPAAATQVTDDLESGSCSGGSSSTPHSAPMPSAQFAATAAMRLSSEALTDKSASVFWPQLLGAYMRRAAASTGPGDGKIGKRDSSAPEIVSAPPTQSSGQAQGHSQGQHQGPGQAAPGRGPGAASAAEPAEPCLCSRGGVAEDRRAHTFTYEAALAAYQGARFAEAHALLKELAAQYPEDLSVAGLCRRAASHLGSDGSVVDLSHEELRDWTGVLNMVDK